MIEKVAEKGLDDLFNRGVLGTACVFLILLLIVAGWVIRRLYNDVQACNAISLQDRRDLITAVEATKDGQERLVEMLGGLKVLLETGRGSSVDLSHQLDLVMEKVRHGFGNLSNAMDALVRLADRGRFAPGSAPVRQRYDPDDGAERS